MKAGQRIPLAERIARFTSRAANGCLEWTGALNDAGYARIVVNGRNLRAHRVNWEASYGPIPQGLFVLHRCDNPKCVDPEHMFLGTIGDNTKDMMDKGRGNVGERQWCSKLTLPEVKSIRYNYPQLTHKELAEIFGVSFQQVSRIRRGINWNHFSLNI